MHKIVNLKAPRRKLGHHYPCKICEEDFPLEHSKQLTCSEACRHQNVIRYKKIYYIRHQNKLRRTTLAYYYDKKEHITPKRAAYYQENKERENLKSKIYYILNKERILARLRDKPRSKK